MKKLLIILGTLAMLVVLLLAGAFYALFGTDQKARSGPLLPHGIEQVADNIATVYLIDAGQGKLVMIDAGADTSGKPTIEALKARGKTPADISAIFVTHAHSDHDASIQVFKNAKIYGLQEEVGIASGKEPYNSPMHKMFGNFNQYPFLITNPLHDEESVKIGDTQFTAYKMTGHTPGSAAYLVQGVLFTGDAMCISSALKIEGPIKIFSRDYPRALQSLKELLVKLKPREKEIEVIATSHNGNLPGPEGLKKIAEFNGQN